MEPISIVFAVTTVILTVTNTITALRNHRLNERNREDRVARERSEDERREADDRRRDAESALTREREHQRTLADRPVIVVEHAGATTNGPIGRRLVKIRVSNMGPTTAHQVEVGIRLDGDELRAGPGGTPTPVAAIPPGGTPLVVMAQVDHDRWQGRPLVEVDRPALWARWTDALGNPYGASVEP